MQQSVVWRTIWPSIPHTLMFRDNALQPAIRHCVLLRDDLVQGLHGLTGANWILSNVLV